VESIDVAENRSTTQTIRRLSSFVFRTDRICIGTSSESGARSDMTPKHKKSLVNRSMFMASVTGAAVCSMTLSSFADLPYLAGPPANVPVIQEPAHLSPNSGRPIADQSGSLSLTAGQMQPNSGQPAYQQQATYPQYGQQMGNAGYVQPVTSATPQGQPYSQNQYPIPGSPYPTSNNQYGNAYPMQGNQYPMPGMQPYPGQPEEKKKDDHEKSADSKRVGFLDRINRLFRWDQAEGPPVDPGMVYPTASSPGSPPRAPGATMDLSQVPPTPSDSTMQPIPAIPPVVQGGPQPGLFQAPTTANPIHDLIPPSPTGLPPAPVGSPQVQASHAPKQIPELKALMESSPTAPNQTAAVETTPAAIPATPATPATAPTPATPASTQIASAPATVAPATVAPPPGPLATRPSLPAGDANAPLPQPATKIAPGEPSGTATAQTPAANPAPAQSKDPFNDLFPEDVKTAKAEPSASPAKPDSQPFTGLTLEATPPSADAKSTAIAKAQPEQSAQSVQAIPPTAMPEEQPLIIPAAPAKTVPAPSEVASTDTAEKPSLNLTVSKDPPVLSTASTSTDAPRIEPASTSTKLKNEEHRSKMERIAARKDRKGLKGFCPVVLRDERDLVDSNDEFSVIYNGHRYEFSSHDSMEKFLAEPAKYAPAAGGCDVLHLALTGEELEGSLDHAVWYKGRLYLFADVETMETFVAAPSSHATND
jgi:YHS domain-containing protein